MRVTGHVRRPGSAVAALIVLAAVGLGTRPAAANLPSQENGRIAFQRNDDAQGEIWVLSPGDASPAALKVTTDGLPEARPAWGPKFHQQSPSPFLPSYLAFQRLENGDWDIWHRPITGPGTFGDAVPLAAGPGHQVEPVYSDAITPVAGTPASGTALLAYVEIDDSGRRELWLRDGAGVRTQLTFDGAGYANPDFGGRFRDLAGGTQRIDLVFEATRDGRQGLWTIEVVVDWTTGGLVSHETPPRLIASGPERLSAPSWQVTNPDDQDRVRDVLFTTQESGVAYLDYVEEPLTGQAPFGDPSQVVRFQLTGDPGGDDGPFWAPFGDQIAFSRTAGENADIWVMSADGASLRRLTDHPGPDINPSWEPGEESSADRVGGHTSPGPVSRTRRGGGTNAGSGGGAGGGGQSVRRRSPGLAIRSVRWRARRIVIAGRAARGLAGRVRVSFSCGSRARHRSTRRVRARDGRFRARMTTRRACRRARRGVARATYGGDKGFLSQGVSRRARRR